MPECDGIEATLKIRELEKQRAAKSNTNNRVNRQCSYNKISAQLEKQV